jgi:hypothetical protein
LADKAQVFCYLNWAFTNQDAPLNFRTVIYCLGASGVPTWNMGMAG